MKNRFLLIGLALLSSLLLSLPWLVPGCGVFALVGFVPLLIADSVADNLRMKHFWGIHYLCFVIWNALTTFWVCNATLGGGVFAVLANALQMSVVWSLFRFSKRSLGGVLPYVFLAFAWVAWEKVYFSLDFAWPWLVLGNAFAGSVKLVQWYEWTGHLGGSLWVWVVNLGVFGMLAVVSDGLWNRWRPFSKYFSVVFLALVILLPIGRSLYRYETYEAQNCGELDVVIAQPDFDPYEKFGSMSQSQQTAVLLGLWEGALVDRDSSDTDTVLLMAPETFTSDVIVNAVEESPTVKAFRDFQRRHANTSILSGVSCNQFFYTHSEPSVLARKTADGWVVNHNSALMLQKDAPAQFFHKSRLVVGVEKTPYPKIFVPVDEWLGGKLGYSSLMGRCEGQDEISVLDVKEDLPVGCAICYESVFGDYCTGYVRRGAKAMTVITNDAWWGDTPGYRQHLNYSRLRAIELRRDIARCANTGISAFINSRGDVVMRTAWWEREVLKGKVNLSETITPFVLYGDICGRICCFSFLLMLLLVIVRRFVGR